MKKKYFFAFLCCLFFFAAHNYSIEAIAEAENDHAVLQLSDLTVISRTEDKVNNGNEIITTTTTVYEEGFSEVEILTVSRNTNGNVLTRSIGGTTTASKQKIVRLSDDTIVFDVTFRAEFSWDGDQAKCISKSNTYTLIKTYEIGTLEMSSGVYTVLGLAYGTAYADLDYYIYLKNVGVGYFEGTVTIDCKKNGEAS